MCDRITQRRQSCAGASCRGWPIGAGFTNTCDLFVNQITSSQN